MFLHVKLCNESEYKKKQLRIIFFVAIIFLWHFRIGRSIIYKIVPEICNAIWQVFQSIYLPAMRKNQWERMAKEYENK